MTVEEFLEANSDDIDATLRLASSIQAFFVETHSYFESPELFYQDQIKARLKALSELADSNVILEMISEPEGYIFSQIVARAMARNIRALTSMAKLHELASEGVEPPDSLREVFDTTLAILHES